MCLSVSSMVIFTQLNSTKNVDESGAFVVKWFSVAKGQKSSLLPLLLHKPSIFVFRCFSASDFTGTRTLSGSYEENWSERSQVSNVGSGFMKNGRWMSSWNFSVDVAPAPNCSLVVLCWMLFLKRNKEIRVLLEVDFKDIKLYEV